MTSRALLVCCRARGGAGDTCGGRRQIEHRALRDLQRVAQPRQRRTGAGRAISPGNAQADAVAEIIQRVRPDVLLINEFDYYPNNQLATAFQDNYLDVAHNGAAPIDYPYVFVAPSNTGEPSGHDLDNNGSVGGPNDAYGFGFFPGQFGMAVFSRYPIDLDAVRTFQTFLWQDMPGALLPDNPATTAPADWYSPAELDVFRLSSKSHWDVPIAIAGRRSISSSAIRRHRSSTTRPLSRPESTSTGGAIRRDPILG